MITETNMSGVAAQYAAPAGKYIGVASVKVLAVNPSNADLRRAGWSVPDGAEEPSYVTVSADGTARPRVRVLAQIQELPGKPAVAMDFPVRPEYRVNQDGTKTQIIDRHGNSAWATTEDVAARRVPQYSNGPAVISTPYKRAHIGEEQLVRFIAKYLNVTPFRAYNRVTGKFEPTANPGVVTIDDWDALCRGDATELRNDFALKPDNLIKVCLGIRTSDSNRTYQTFLQDGFWSNAVQMDLFTGEFTVVKGAIDKYIARVGEGAAKFGAGPVHLAEEPGPDIVQKAPEAAPASVLGGPAAQEDLPFGDGEELPF